MVFLTDARVIGLPVIVNMGRTYFNQSLFGGRLKIGVHVAIILFFSPQISDSPFKKSMKIVVFGYTLSKRKVTNYKPTYCHWPLQGKSKLLTYNLGKDSLLSSAFRHLSWSLLAPSKIK